MEKHSASVFLESACTGIIDGKSVSNYDIPVVNTAVRPKPDVSDSSEEESVGDHELSDRFYCAACSNLSSESFDDHPEDSLMESSSTAINVASKTSSLNQLLAAYAPGKVKDCI